MNNVGSDVELRDLSKISDLRKAWIEVRVPGELLLVRDGVRKREDSPACGQNQAALLIDFVERGHAFFWFAIRLRGT